MKDMIVKLNNNINYYVIETIDFDKKKYAFCVECDKEKEEILNNYIIVEVKLKNDDLVFDNIENLDLLNNIQEMFFQKLEDNAE